MLLRYAIRAIWISLLLSSSFQLAFGAKISRQTEGDIDVITVQDEIKIEDISTFRNVANASRKALVLLDSPGGSALAGMEMGKIIHQRNFITGVPNNSMCASACALMWLGGSERLIAAGGAVGFHAVYISQGNGTLKTSSEGNALVGAYLHELGFSQNVIIFVTQAPPEKMGWLSEGVARELPLSVVWVGLNGPSSSQPLPRTEVQHQAYDPVSTVTRFYRALGAADGDTAAALVIPEKRGIGNFNERKMAEFFGNMREPLSLRSAPRRTGPDSVQVDYHYVYASGRICNARAEVTTKYLFGKTLIEKIAASC
jgi:hypothetical protein